MDDLFHEMPGTLVSRSAVAKAKKRGEVYESAKAGGAIGAMAGGGLGTASGLGLIASGAAEPMIRQNPSKAGRALTRTFVPLNTGVRGAARWGVAGVGLGAAAGVYGKHKRKKQSSAVSKAYQSWTFVPVKAAAKAKKASLPAGPKPRPKAPNAYVPPRTIRDPRKSVSVNQNKRPPSVWD